MLNMQVKRKSILASLAVATLMLAACGGENQNTTSQETETTPAASPAATGSSSNLSGNVLGDGSSTVFPVSEAMAEEFQKKNPGVKVTVGVSGTGGGFKKFCANEIDFTGASRPIKPSEVELCKKNNVEYVELPIAYDALSVVVNPANNFASCLKVDELKKVWEPAAQGKITTWNQVRSSFPNEKLGLYGAGTDSGTYDYFTAAIVGEEGKSRGDYTASEDDNTIVQGVAGDKNGMGFFGLAYYEENQNKLKLVQIDDGKGCVTPSPETVRDGTYQPLSRPIFIYVKKSVANRPDVKVFTEFYLAKENEKLVSEVGYVPLPEEIYVAARDRFAKGTTGSIFEGKGSTVGLKLADLLKQETGGK
jgi:phosphate transport system substrate-binding protein